MRTVRLAPCLVDQPNHSTNPTTGGNVFSSDPQSSAFLLTYLPMLVAVPVSIAVTVYLLILAAHLVRALEKLAEAATRNLERRS